MAKRNPKVDKAKRQAVGINHTVAPFAVGDAYAVEFSKALRNHKGEASHPGKTRAQDKSVIGPALRNDRRVVEGEKPALAHVKAEPVEPLNVKVLPAAEYRPIKFSKGQATPQLRGFMGSFVNGTPHKRVKGERIVTFTRIGGLMVKQVGRARVPSGPVYATGAVLIKA